MPSIFVVCPYRVGGLPTILYQFSKTGGGNINNLTEQQAKDITLQYLIALYGKDRGLKLFAEKQNHLFEYHGLAYSLGKECFPYFCNLYLYDLLFDYSDGKVPLSNRHFEIWGEIQDNILNKNNTKNCYIFPRSFAKTNSISLPCIIWSAVYCIHPYNIIISATQKQAETFLADIKNILMDNDYIKYSFGDIFGNKDLKNNVSELELDIYPNRSKIQCFSATSGIRGVKYNSKRIGLLVLDDSQERDLIKSEENRKELVKRLNDGALNGLQNDNNHCIAVGTVQFRNDVYDSFCHSIEWQHKREKCILLDDIDDYFGTNQHWLKVKSILSDKDNYFAMDDARKYYEEHKTEMDYPIIWEKYDRMELALKYYADPISFKQEYQSDIDHLGERLIHSLYAVSPEEIESEEFTHTILSIDPAATVNANSDYSAFTILSDTENKTKYARKIIIERLEFDDYINRIIDLLVQYTDIEIISIEKQVFMGSDVSKLRERLQIHPLLRNRTFNIINKMRSKNKDNRIRAIIPDINFGRIIFNAADEQALQQIYNFCGCQFTEHDDAIDSLTDAIENITTIEEEIPKLRVLDLAAFGL